MKVSKVFIAIVDGKVAGWSYKKKIVKQFLDDYHASNTESSLAIAKSNDQLYDVKWYKELVAVGNVYVPQKYAEAYLELRSGIRVDNIDEAIDILSNAIPLNNDEIKMKMLSAISYLQYIRNECDRHIPSLSVLELEREAIIRYRECSGLYPP